MESVSYLTNNKSNGYRPTPNDSVSNKSLTPIVDRFKALLKEREDEIRVSNGDNDDVILLDTEDIVELYEAVLSDLIVNSKPIITDLTIIAGEQRQHGAGIADAICARIIEALMKHATDAMKESRVQDFLTSFYFNWLLLSQPETNDKMRAILID